MPHFKKTFLDIVDSSGNPLGITKSYDEVHQEGLWHKGVHVWLVNNKGELLLQKRSMHVHTYPGLWESSAGGHIDAGHTSIFTAQKELKEELGVDLPEEDFEFGGTIVDQFVTNNGTAINNEFDDFYIVSIGDKKLDITIEEDEITEVQWMRFTDLEEKINAKDDFFVPRPNEFPLLFAMLHTRFDDMVN